MDEKMREFAEDEQISQLLRGLDDNIEVPLDAAAAWRKAVRHEARKMKWLGRTRWAVELAAAIALVIGATFAWRSLSTSPVQSADTSLSYQRAASTRYTFYTSDSFSEAKAGGAVLVGNDGEEDAREETVDRGSDDAVMLFSTAAAKDVLTDAFNETVETEEGAAEARIRIANVGIASADPSKDFEKLSTIVSETPSAYFEEKVLSEEQYSGKIRVRNEQLDQMLILLTKELNCSVKLDEHSVNYLTQDLSVEIDNAYGEVDRLQLELGKTRDDDEISKLKTQLQAVLDEIAQNEQKIESSQYDLEYATVFYTMNDHASSGIAVAASQSTGFTGFLKDMTKALVILLPTAALSVLITLHIQKRKKQRV